MRISTILPIICIFLLNSCSSCDEQLFGTCPSQSNLNRPCTIKDGEIFELLIASVPGISLEPSSACKLGTTKCSNETNEIVCDGFVPSTVEICGDGIDNDCDSLIDEGFDKDNDGVLSCLGDCNDEDSSISPNAYEVCNRKDDDCNGVIDDLSPMPCWDGPPDLIQNLEQTECSLGQSSCINGKWTACVDQVLPEEELCNHFDDNCNGILDDNPITNGQLCGPQTGIGACRRGREICVSGESFCIEAIMESPEVCNNIDDDCDGTVDNNLSQLCETVCEVGVEFCDKGRWKGCTARNPTIELCDGIDNNCDGTIDEGCVCDIGDSRYCTSNMVDDDGNQKLCGIGTQSCDTSGQWTQCIYVGNIPETCNLWDDDCQNGIDDVSEECGPTDIGNIGICRLGQRRCVQGVLTRCSGAIFPKKETCNNIDDDCDGLVDEGINREEKVDLIFLIDASGSMCGKVEALRQGIDNFTTGFEGTDHRFGLLTFPGRIDVGPTPAARAHTTPILSDVSTLSSTLGNITCAAGGIESTYDAIGVVSNPSDILNIDWRYDAKPYLVIVTDEPGQTISGITEAFAAQDLVNCQVGNCVQGDILSTYVIGPTPSYSTFDDLIGFDQERFFDIKPVSGGRYTEILSEILQEICRNE